MNHFKLILTYGFAIFAMFFGSGNLVFPISIGFYSGDNWIAGFLGLFITGIILPFLGLFVIKLYKGNYYDFFGDAGRFAKNLIPFFTLSLLGSFGVIPRCITVAHGGINYLFQDFGLITFALAFSIISFIFCLNEKFMIKILGKWMSPFLLVALLILIAFGIFDNNDFEIKKAENSFSNGFLVGYQTMDLFAAFFFSSLTFSQIQNSQIISEHQIFKFAIKASLVGSLLLSIIYLGFVYLGARYSYILINISPEHMLPAITKHIMGDVATLFLAIVMILSCFTTAIALNNIYAQYLCNLFKLDEGKFPHMLFVTIFISFIISLLDFKIIASFLGPILEISYPGLIFLTISSIVTRKYKNIKKYVFWTITLAMLLYVAV